MFIFSLIQFEQQWWLCSVPRTVRLLAYEWKVIFKIQAHIPISLKASRKHQKKFSTWKTFTSSTITIEHFLPLISLFVVDNKYLQVSYSYSRVIEFLLESDIRCSKISFHKILCFFQKLFILIRKKENFVRIGVKLKLKVCTTLRRKLKTSECQKINVRRGKRRSHEKKESFTK